MSVFPASGAATISFVWLGAVFAVGLFGSEFLDRLFGRRDGVPEEAPAPEEADDPFQAFEDEWDDDWLDAEDPEPGRTDHLEPRIDDLEEELDRLASTVSTVRSENEAIAETVDEMEENVRKLLEIYEVVSRGANPFVEEDGPGGMSEEPFQSSATTAADELVDQVSDDFDLNDGSGLFGGMDGAGDIEQEEAADTDDDSMTFEDLKAEYQRAEADTGSSVDRAGETAAGGADPESSTDDEQAGGGDRPSDRAVDGRAELNPGSGDDRGPDPHNSPDGGATPQVSGSAKPYLHTLPEGYVAELIMLEWVDFLRQSAEPSEVLWTVDYYQRIEWIDQAVADHLRTVVEGLTTEPVSVEAGGAEGASLTIDHHTKSLEYISRLDGDPVDFDGVSNRLGE